MERIMQFLTEFLSDGANTEGRNQAQIEYACMKALTSEYDVAWEGARALVKKYFMEAAR